MNTQKQVLVVGGAGYIGSHVVLQLMEKGFDVIVLDDLSTGCRVNLFPENQFYQADMRKPDVLKHVFNENNIHAVIHLAALKAAGDSMIKPSTYAIHNISGTLTLLEACLDAGVSKFIFSSSAAVYGDPVYVPMDEKHPLDPTNFYGFTKLEIERVLLWYLKLRGLKFASLRYFNAAGYDAQGRIKGLERDPKNLIPLVMETATGVRSELSIFGDTYATRDGSCIRDYIHVTDLAKAHVSAIGYLDQNDQLTCNLGTGNGTSVFEVIQAFEKLLGKRLTCRITDKRDGDPAELMASAAFAGQAISWTPENSSIENILKTTWRAYQSHDQTS